MKRTPRMSFCIRAATTLHADDLAALTDSIEAYAAGGAPMPKAEALAIEDALAQVRADRVELTQLLQQQHPTLFKAPAEEGGDYPKPAIYKTRRAAEQARTGNTQRLRKTKDGFILRDATDKELAAAEKSGRRLSGSGVDVEKDSLLAAIAKLGGLAMRERSDTIGEGNRNIGGKMLFTNGGQALDTMADGALREYGYVPLNEVNRDGGVRWLRDAIKSEFNNGTQHFSEQGTEAIMQREQAAQEAEFMASREAEDIFGDLDADEVQATGYTAASPEVQALTEQAVAHATAQGVDVESVRERVSMQTEGLSQDEYETAVQQALIEAVSEIRSDAARSNASAASGSNEDRGPGADRQGQEEGLTLEAQDAQGLREKTEREAKAKADEAKTKTAEQERLRREAEASEINDRARQDASADNFVLGQDANDALAGQGGLFDAPAVGAPAQQPSSIQDVGEKIGGARKDTAVSTGTTSKRVSDADRPAWARRFEVSQIVTSGGQINEVTNAGRWEIRDTRSLDWMKQPKQVGRYTYATKEEADAFVPIAAVSLKHRPVPTSGGKYEIWRDITDRKRVKVVEQQFDSREDAMAYMAQNAASIVETNTTFGEADLPLPPDRARTGPARREGNVGADDFKNTFGFRGVEFGNWNNQDERQSLMNDAWDGLMDLADVLGVPPKALGLNGDLALAFGARGHGLQSARAHYENQRAVINLTKENGAGSLAHEFFHGMDHYFARQDGKASAKWEVQPDGTRILTKAKGGGEDFLSAGSSYKSGVRPELRAAYDKVLATMFKKAQGYVEDTTRADKFTGAAREDLAESLDKLRAYLSEQQDVHYYKRNNKPASAEQLAEFDALAAKILAGDSLSTDWRTFAKEGARGPTLQARWTNDALESLSAIHKTVRGRSGFDAEKKGALDRLRGSMERYSQRLKMLADAQAGTEKQKMVPTDFAMNAKELDQGRGTDYWTTTHEMAARAFQGYVEDKIAERGGISRFLNYAPANAAIPTPWGFKRPYPAGAERVAINKAFDEFVGELKTRTGAAGNVAMYSRTNTAKFESEVSEAIRAGVAGDEQSLRQQVALGINTPTALRALGVADKPVYTNRDLLAKMHIEHGLSRTQLNGLAGLLENPALVFKSDTQAGRLLLVTDIVVSGKPVVVAIEPNGRAGRLEVVFLPSAYVKDDLSAFTRWIRAGLLMYADKGRSRLLATTAGLQLPGVVTRAVGFTPAQYKTEADLSKPGNPDALSRRDYAPANTTTADLRAALEAEFSPEIISALEKAGLLTLSDRPSAGMPADAAGATQNGRISLFAANTAPGSTAVAYHEALHATLRQSIGEDAYNALMDRLGRIDKAAADGGPVQRFFAEAAGRIPANMTGAERLEELASYAVEQYQRARETMPSIIKRWVGDLIAALRAGLVKALNAAGVGVRLRAQLLADPATLHKIARDGLKGMARQGMQGDAAMAYSRSFSSLRGARPTESYVDATPRQQATLDAIDEGPESTDFDLIPAKEDINRAADAAFTDWEQDGGIKYVSLEMLGPFTGYNNDKDAARIRRLADAIKSSNTFEPIFVGVDPNGEAYVMEGQHRARALQLLGETHIPAQVIVSMEGTEADYDAAPDVPMPVPTDYRNAAGQRPLFSRAPATDTEPRYSRSFGKVFSDATSSARQMNLVAGYKVGDLMEGAGRVSWWHRSVGTMQNLAKRSPAFARVYDATQSFIYDASYYAAQAAELAPAIMPKLDKFTDALPAMRLFGKDVGKEPLSAADATAVGKTVFDGTLKWGRDIDGKALPMAEVKQKLGALPLDDKAHQMLRDGAIDAKVLRMWQGLPQEQYETIIEGKFEREYLQPGVVFTEAELRQHFGLNERQISLYSQSRAAIDKSLTDLSISQMLKQAGDDALALRNELMDSGDIASVAQRLADHLGDLAQEQPDRAVLLRDTAGQVQEVAEQAQRLIKMGYAPLSRFGQYTLEATTPDGERLFTLFDTDRARNKMARELEAAGATGISTGTLSQEEFKLLQGISPESTALFGEILGLDSQGSEAKDVAFQALIKRAVANQSAMKRLLQRKGVAGYSEDVGRVLAAFVYSNARLTSSNLHKAEMLNAVEAIPKEQGQLKDVAVRLREYVQNPQEEAVALRGLLFSQYLGGSIASAIVNATQPFTMTFPFLSQWGGVRAAARQMARAMKDASRDSTGDAALDAALKKAEEDGIVSPQEIHHLQAQAMGKASLVTGDGTKLGNAWAKVGNARSKGALVWGKVFSVAEQFNRRVTYVAAYRTAVEQRMENPDGFARDAVNQTQGVYNKGSKPEWARGAVGSVLFTFKTYSINYIEMLHRMWNVGAPEPGASPERAAQLAAERAAGRKAVLLALAVLFLMAGSDGLPFAENIDDVIDAALQRMGYNIRSKQARKAFFANIIGQGGAEFLTSGLSGLPGAPIDISGRMSMGKLIPGLGLLQQKPDHSRDMMELAGPVADLGKRALMAANHLSHGDVAQARLAIAPTAVRNVAKGADMLHTGMYRDDRGRKVVDTDVGDAVAKIIGFQPRAVKQIQDATAEVQRAKSQYQMAKAEIHEKMARARFEDDAKLVQEARDDVATWNRKNPGQTMTPQMPAVIKRLREMRMSKAERVAATAPKALRAEARRYIAEELQ